MTDHLNIVLWHLVHNLMSRFFFSLEMEFLGSCSSQKNLPSSHCIAFLYCWVPGVLWALCMHNFFPSFWPSVSGSQWRISSTSLNKVFFFFFSDSESPTKVYSKVGTFFYLSFSPPEETYLILFSPSFSFHLEALVPLITVITFSR